MECKHNFEVKVVKPGMEYYTKLTHCWKCGISEKVAKLKGEA